MKFRKTKLEADSHFVVRVVRLVQKTENTKTQSLNPLSFAFLCTTLKDKSGVGIIVDYSRDYNVVNGVEYFFSIVFSFNLRHYIFQSSKKCEMTSFYMTSLDVDLNEAAKCVDIIPPIC